MNSGRRLDTSSAHYDLPDLDRPLTGRYVGESEPRTCECGRILLKGDAHGRDRAEGFEGTGGA